jgi:ATP-binding cassette subfamily B protein
MSGGGWHVLAYGQKAEKTQITREQFWRILGYFRPYWREAIAVLGVISCSAFLGLVPPLLLRQLLDGAIPHKDWHTLHVICGAMMVLPIITGLLGVLETYLDERISQGVMLDLRLLIFGALQAQSMDYFTTNRPGDISSRLNNDVNDLADIFSDTVVAITSNILILATTVAVVFTLDWHLALLAMAIVPLFIPPAWWVGKLRQDIVKQAQERRSDLHSLVQDTMSINGFLIRRIFGHLSEERARYAKVGREFGQIQMRRSVIWRWFALTLSLVGILGPTAIYWYGGGRAIEGAISIGTIVAFVAYLGRLYGPMSALATIHVQIQSSLAVFERLFVVLDAVPSVRDRPDARETTQVEGHLRFDDVSFRYREDRALLDHVSFEVKPGQFVALVGPSGAGKTSLTYMIPRFYDPTEGRITLDGHDLRDMTLESLQSQVAMVTQEPFLFHTTLRENLRIAKPNASDEEVEAACRAAYIHEAIAVLPEGYDTVVGERGYRLSGGDRQRLALARVILKSPRVLILDEATSSLDSQSEALIQQALAPLMRGRTTISIAHRLSTILHADLILVLEAGQIVERGQHAELLAAGGLYARLYQEQFKGDAPRAADGAVVERT